MNKIIDLYLWMLLLVIKFVRIFTNKKNISLLIAPPGGGNIGDQALVEAYLENTSDFVTIAVKTNMDFVFSENMKNKAEFLIMPKLIYGHVAHWFIGVFKIINLFARVKKVAIVGADIMDGAYNERASCNRARWAKLSSALGVDTRVLGFSWNGNPHPNALNYLRKASEVGTKLMLRDPLSYQRALADGLKNVTLVSDMVFSAKTFSEQAFTAIQAKNTMQKPLVILNASGLVQKQLSQVQVYSFIITELLKRGYFVVLLPHVSRQGADDLIVCKEIFDLFKQNQDLYLIEELLSPASIRGLAKNACFVVTGRMHLAVMSLISKIPAITISTQGKVEGLMQLFESPSLCVELKEGMELMIINVINKIELKDREILGDAENSLNRVKSLSALNFA